MARQDEARRDEIRVGDAERDAVTLAMHDHFAAGRLDRGELDERLDAVLAAKTRGDLRALVRDLPAPTGLTEPEKPAPAAVPWGPYADPRMRRHQLHMRHHHHHGPHFKAFPLLLGVFLVLTFTVGPGAGFLAVLQIALVVWVVRAVLLAVRTRRSGTGA